MNSDFSEFLGLPFMRAMIPMMCFISLLLIATIVAIVIMRRRKAQKTMANMVTSPGFVTAADYGSGGHEMPDLNLLLHTSTPASAPEPVIAPKAASPAPAMSAPAPLRSARKGTFTITPKDGNVTEAVEVLTILRDVMDGTLLIQMGENTYLNVNSNPEFKERFSKLMREVGQMITKTSSPAPAAANPESETFVSPSEPDVIPSADETMQGNEPSFLIPKVAAAPPPPVASGVKLPGDLPSFRLADNPMKKIKRGEELPPVPEINIAGAIEAYLQHKISVTPQYAGRNIHIYPAPGGGVSIEVDGKYFEAVSDVTDVPVREFLSDTIAEWQERH